MERRQALLRDQLHKVDAQLCPEDLQVPFKYCLAEAVFAGSFLLPVNGSTLLYGVVWTHARHVAI
eukprot:976288-Lingulodinium_polyedra.AAC.1